VGKNRGLPPTQNKRGGYTGSKPGSEMKPPVHRPSAVVARPSEKPSPNGDGGK
jgi:hypothetical protein